MLAKQVVGLKVPYRALVSQLLFIDSNQKI